MRAREFISEVMPLVGLTPQAKKTGQQAAQQGTDSQQDQQPQQGVKKTQGTQGTQPTNQKNKTQAAIDAAKDKLIRPGANIPLPTTKGQMQNFKVSRVQGDEVEIENPDADKAPEQPEKIVYKKDDIKKSIR